MFVKRAAVLLAILAVAGGSVLKAAALEEKSNEWNLAVERIDINDVGEDPQYTLEWGHLFGNGALELGISASFLDVSFDDQPGSLPDFDADGWSFGPTFTWNWSTDTPLTGYLFANASKTQGDFSDQFDTMGTAGIGLKWFLGDAFALRAAYGVGRAMGEGDRDDEDFTRAIGGVSFYTGK